jgi:hypothetical protein
VKHLLAVVLLYASTAYAQIGSITEFQGSATIKRGKDIITAQKGTAIEQNDQVETKNGKLKITFKDDTTVSVTEHSKLVIDDFVYDPKSGKGSLGLKAAGGTVRYVSGALAKDPKQVKINTPTAAIAVRGTDFVMSVNEIGSSMVILMPSCDWETSAVKGVSCTTGKIDVESGPNLVSMNRPYQATLVESAGQPPTPPVIVNLFGAAIGNNLQIAPPRTTSGASVVAAARAAAAATGVIREGRRDEKEDKEDHKEAESKVASKQDRASGSTRSESSEDSETKIVRKKEDELETISSQTVSASETENPNLFALYADKSQTKQIGWMFESLSGSGRNYANVTQTMNSQVQVTITQDMQTVGHNFSTGRAIGSITIIQTAR